MNDRHPYSIDDFKSQLMQDNPKITASDLEDYSMIFNQVENFEYPDSQVSVNWNTLKSKLENQSTLKVFTPRKPQFHMFKWLSAAVVLLMLSFGVWQYLKPSASIIQHYVSNNNVLEIQLEDGSQIKLNKNSRLDVLTLTNSERKVKLIDGEAFFHVKHNNASFVVLTSQGNVVVKGTKFNVKDRKSIPLSISLKEGSIQYETTEQFLEMVPGETIMIDRVTNSIVKSLDKNNYAWLEGELRFSNQSLSDIIKELSAVYQVNFKYDEKLASEKLTINFQNLTAQQSADLLSKTINSPVVIE
ncbi:MAG: FecR domain-containing protein [Bacteroidota bacterium]|nr:FecR domain-containing protein [Bacteroidota bacterium]